MLTTKAKNSKRKLGLDPNNTKWSRNIDSYGQRLLRSQGWEPGQYLGASGAEHAKWHTEANSTHIRVVLKDDQLGLGAKRNNGDECTGLFDFQHLLGRLNGKSDDALEAERKAREDRMRGQYVEKKLGMIRFVSGGFLVGDQLVDEISEESAKLQLGSESEEISATSAEEMEEPKPTTKRSKKRKAEEDADASGKESRKSRKREKKSKGSEKGRVEGRADVDDAELSKEKDEKKSRKRKAKDTQDESAPSGNDDSEVYNENATAGAKESRSERKVRREREKREKKERKEKRREAKAASKKAEASNSETISGSLRSDVSTPSGSGYSTPITGSSRYLARSRFIAQKRMALTDATALNQVCNNLSRCLSENR